ncbi:TonB-dependent receptor [Asticcacaulis sp. YBE204]|uniref:TonB-dependent receptor n=1 Tax=Asticcacaulis sp. YBE204 TaxID=1282363 RepID=UPI0003C3EA98|nr:TonB-dependent receptor [Asticcacaulis sp. YBE204]ESQ79231.1 hypothetical protein AEYBE204_09485 [Asticcacaulis sp. YBE204]
MRSSGLAAILLVAGATVGMAQQTASVPQSANGDETTTVIVVGSRASQQSAIDRKKKAKTATDSIVADDVGSFPDRNLAEALSRIPGMALQRGETGEGAGVNLRGNSNDLTRVEMDGMSVTGGGFDLANATDGGGRGSDLRELPADLIKSIDVVKGNTPDLTEGGLGGSVQIQTRTGLDFKKPYFSMRVSGERNSLSQRWSPDINLVASRKFFNNRLGVIFNLSTTRKLNDSHQLNNAGSSNAQGYARAYDFDNSPNKTFQFNPSTVSGVGATDPVASWALATGTGNFNTLSPLEIVTRSANAKTKAECLTALPLYTAAELNTISAGSNNNNRRDAQAQRISEQVTCLNQWNDYSPASVRDVNLTQYEKRISADIRFDYRVNDNLNVYLKYQIANRDQEDIRRNRSRGGIGSTFSTTPLVTNTNIAVGTINPVTPITGFYLFNAGMPTGSVALDSTLAGSNVQNSFPYYGVGVNVVPGSYKVDANHYLTEFDFNNGSIFYDNIRNDQVWQNNYLLVGGNYKKGPLKIDFQASRSSGTYSRYDKRFSLQIPYGTGHMEVQESGLWSVEYPANFNPDDWSSTVPMLAPTGTAQQQAEAALYSATVAVNYSPLMSENGEKAAKFDLTYRLPEVPFLKLFKTGVSYRNLENERWGGGGYTPVPGVNVPTNTLRGNIRACENQATTTAANRCVYGYVPNALTGTNFNHGQETVTRAQLLSLYQNSVESFDGAFMPGYEGVEGLSLWNTIDVEKAFNQMAGNVNMNFDCMKVCTGSDGKLYAQPTNRTFETITAAYYMFEFEQKLPFNMSFDGNFGVRMVKSEVEGIGTVAVSSIRKIISTPANPATDWNATTGNTRVTTTTLRRPISIERSYTDWMPSYNANLWLIDDKLVLRYNWSKSVARPSPGKLWPAGECSVDERIEDRFDEGEEDLDMTCSTFGNPDLKPYRANKNNTSIEWYPNRDSSFSLAYFRQKVLVGGPETVRVTDQPVFTGTDEVDPITGRKLSDFLFTFNTYKNGEGYVMSGWEFSSKTAFTFLPWYLRYTGADFNISTNDSKGRAGYIDPITGDSLGVPSRAKYFANLAVWYDDGKTNARIAYQRRDRVFSCVSACGRNVEGVYAFPNQNPNNFVRLPYNPGEAYYTKEYAYLDAKVTHKLSPNVELYWEGRNLLKEANIQIGSDARGFVDQEYQWAASYGGRRFTVGFVYRN